MPLEAAPAESVDSIQAPPGFQVTLYADDNLAHDVFAMTIDARGRVVVSGPGYVKILHDTDGDGRADKASLFSDVPRTGAQGLFFDGNDLICPGDGALLRFRDADGDGQADGEPEKWIPIRKTDEHGAHAVVRGPDGWLYLMCGNDAGLSDVRVTMPTSPIKESRCGGILRLSPDGSQREVIAHGFRNPYDMAFNAEGHLFTVDSDGERDYQLPWYAPTRLFDVALGMEHGWLLEGWTRCWSRPASYLDNVERLAEIGRGSPTGVVVYQHRQFPTHYRGGVFSACWTLGRVYYFPMQHAGSTYSSKQEVFLQSTGDAGFAPCDLEVGPDGDLFVAVGGRGTRGGVYRVRHLGGSANKQSVDDQSPAEARTFVLTADQPLSSWSRTQWLPLARSLGAAAFVEAMLTSELDVAQRVHAVEVLVDVFGGLTADQSRPAREVKPAAVRARIAWALAHSPQNNSAPAMLAGLTYDESPRVTRAAWEGLAGLAKWDASMAEFPPNWSGALEGTDRRVRRAAILAGRGPGRDNYRRFARALPMSSNVRWKLAGLWIEHAGDDGRAITDQKYIDVCLDCIATADSTADQLDAVRLMQIALGDLRVQPGLAEVFCGYTGNDISSFDDAARQAMVAGIAKSFPSRDAELNRELGRLLAMLGTANADVASAVAAQWTPDSSPTDDVHYLTVLALFDAPRSVEVTQRTAETLLRLQQKIVDRGEHSSQNWPVRVGEVFRELSRRDPALMATIVAHPDFGHPTHALFAADMSGEDARRAVVRLFDYVREQDERCTPKLIALANALPPREAAGYLREQWDYVDLRDSIVQVLARSPSAEDRAKFVDSLASMQSGIVGRAAQTLAKLEPAAGSPAEMRAALAALRQACSLPEQAHTRKVLVQLLARWTGQKIDVREQPTSDLHAAYAPWFRWFEAAHPQEAAELKKSSLADAADWRRRLDGLAWSSGDPKRGRSAYERCTCHRCHDGTARLGPELVGAASRMSRDDLFTAILDPSREISPTYKLTLIASQSTGQVYHGMLVYESPESVLLQTGPDTTVRLTDVDPADMRPSRQSLMPTGLLNQATDQELVDLYAYLKSLAAPAAAVAPNGAAAQ